MRLVVFVVVGEVLYYRKWSVSGVGSESVIKSHQSGSQKVKTSGRTENLRWRGSDECGAGGDDVIRTGRPTKTRSTRGPGFRPLGR